VIYNLKQLQKNLAMCLIESLQHKNTLWSYPKDFFDVHSDVGDWFTSGNEAQPSKVCTEITVLAQPHIVLPLQVYQCLYLSAF
jgi:hypothetical protein